MLVYLALLLKFTSPWTTFFVFLGKFPINLTTHNLFSCIVDFRESNLKRSEVFHYQDFGVNFNDIENIFIEFLLGQICIKIDACVVNLIANFLENSKKLATSSTAAQTTVIFTAPFPFLFKNECLKKKHQK